MRQIELVQPHVEAIDSDDVATCYNANDRIDASDHVANMSAWQPRSTNDSTLTKPLSWLSCNHCSDTVAKLITSGSL